MATHDPAQLPEVANWLSTAATAVGIAIAAAFAYFKKSPAPKPAEELAVVSATFSDRKTIEGLTAALRENSECLTRNSDLMEAEAHRREVDAEVREELRKRGVIP